MAGAPATGQTTYSGLSAPTYADGTRAFSSFTNMFPGARAAQVAPAAQAPAMYQPTFARQTTMMPAPAVQQAGLQALMANMMNQYPNVRGITAMPQQMMMPQPQAPMPQFRSPALAYRPDYQSIQNKLALVKPSVYKSELDTAKARIAELEAQLTPPDTGYSGGG